MSAEQAAMIARDPEKMREVAAEAMRRTCDRLAAADISDADRAHCLHLLETGADMLLLSGTDAGDSTGAHVLMIGAAFGACIAVADVIDGCADTGPQAELHAAMRATGAALMKGGRHAH